MGNRPGVRGQNLSHRFHVRQCLVSRHCRAAELGHGLRDLGLKFLKVCKNAVRLAWLIYMLNAHFQDSLLAGIIQNYILELVFLNKMCPKFVGGIV